MKKWTCCILAVIMLVVFSYPENKTITLDADKTSVSVGENPIFIAIKGITEFFLGIKEESGREIVVDLSSVPSKEILVEIEKIEPLTKPDAENKKDEDIKIKTDVLRPFLCFLGIVLGFLAILKAGGVIYEQRKL